MSTGRKLTNITKIRVIWREEKLVNFELKGEPINRARTYFFNPGNMTEENESCRNEIQ